MKRIPHLSVVWPIKNHTENIFLFPTKSLNKKVICRKKTFRERFVSVSFEDKITEKVSAALKYHPSEKRSREIEILQVMLEFTWLLPLCNAFYMWDWNSRWRVEWRNFRFVSLTLHRRGISINELESQSFRFYLR